MKWIGIRKMEVEVVSVSIYSLYQIRKIIRGQISLERPEQFDHLAVSTVALKPERTLTSVIVIHVHGLVNPFCLSVANRS